MIVDDIGSPQRIRLVMDRLPVMFIGHGTGDQLANLKAACTEGHALPG
jgi:hypothetical protein